MTSISKLSAYLLHAWDATYPIRFGRMKGLDLGKGVVFFGRPIIDIRRGGQIIIGDGVTLNSRNHGYHINMHSPVKLYTDRAGATITIGRETRIHGACLHAYQSITVGERCLIAANCQIFDGSGHDLSFDNVRERINTHGTTAPIVIEDGVWLGANTLVLPGVWIGEGSVVGAGSVVTKDIPAMVVAVGNPARVVRAYDERDAG